VNVEEAKKIVDTYMEPLKQNPDAYFGDGVDAGFTFANGYLAALEGPEVGVRLPTKIHAMVVEIAHVRINQRRRLRCQRI